MKSSVYKPEAWWVLTELTKCVLVIVVVGYVFFQSLAGIFLCIPIGYFLWKRDGKMYERKQKKLFREEFKDAMSIISANLNAGYSLKNAIVYAEHTIEKNMVNNKSIFLAELRIVTGGLRCNRSPEDMLLSMGTRCEIDEVTDLADLIIMSGAYGGNLIELIRKCTKSITEKVIVENEINTIIAAKKLEGNILVVTPVIVVFYMNIINRSYMDFYDSPIGKIIMAAGLCVIVAVGLWINKIMDVEV